MTRSAVFRLAMCSAMAALALPAGTASAAQEPRPAAQADGFAQFAPRDDTVATRLDFSYWNTALRWFVLRMGRSLREYEPQPLAQTGSRFIFGHDSPLRLEGNRVAFSLLPDDARQALSEYRRELEQLPEMVPLTRLSRNEQLAYWINLHNVAVIEQIALAYPVKQPALVRLAGSDLPMDETPFINVAGVRMSPKDIRTRIVYPNWRDPKVIYGFWHGDIGGPSISRQAFEGGNVGELLDYSASEFVNSLRGTQRAGETLLVSRLYLEARPFYFRDWPADLRAHLRGHAEPEVAKLIAETSQLDARISEPDIADLTKGEREPNLTNLVMGDQYRDHTIDGAVARLLTERRDKLIRTQRQNPAAREGQVIVQSGDEEDAPPDVVE